MAVIRTSRRTAVRSRVAVAALAAAGATLLAGCQAGQHAATAQEIPTMDGASAQVGDIALRDVTIEYPEAGSWPRGSDARLHFIVVNQGLATDSLIEVRTEVADSVELRATAATATPEPTATATPEPTATGTPEPTGTATPEPTETGEATPSESPSGSESPSESPSGSESPSESPSGSATPSPTPSPTEETAASIPIPPAGLVSFKGDAPQVVLTGLTRELRSAQVVPITFVFAEAGEVRLLVAVATPLGEVELAPTVPAEDEAAGE